MRALYPSFWFNDNAEEATNFYLGLFPDSEVIGIQRNTEVGHGEPGSVLATHFRIANVEILTINGGPHVTPHPSVSLFVETSDLDRVDALWAALSEGGYVMMEYGEYPWAAKYGWLADRYGVSWQISAGEQEEVTITPALLFVGDQFGKVESAIHRWASIFPNSDTGLIFKHEGADDPAREGTVMFSRFTLGGQSVIAMEDNSDHKYTFTEGASLVAECDDQAEIDRLWDGLIAGGGKPSQCGWLWDPYGLSWQIIPTRLFEMVTSGDVAGATRATQAMYQMQKLDIATLERAFKGE
jgi:predicted 3-demethylubiquinone-9 3-methyltransferase (glyoxalase superfamily)